MDLDVRLIWCQSKTGAIGKDNQLLYQIPQDMARFRQVTMHNTVVMGRKTWESLPEKFRPLPKRRNIVVTRQKDYKAEGAVVVHDLEGFLNDLGNWPEPVVIIGGEAIYEMAVPFAKSAYVTVVATDDEGDAYAPTLDSSPSGDWDLMVLDVQEHEGLKFQFYTYFKRSFS